MNYIQVEIKHQDAAIREMLIAHLADAGFESFEDKDDTLLAYILEGDYQHDDVAAIASQYHCSFSSKIIEQQNWNQMWEDSFEPVVVGDFCMIRAEFHKPVTTCEHEIIITPKMSFGTGHHATTRLMIQQMQKTDLDGKTVLDFGTGTGVLAILAHKLNAGVVLAIDNDEWSYENTMENIGRNNASDINVQQGSLEVVGAETFDIILANINRHILMKYMEAMAQKLNNNGTLILSGILTEDKDLLCGSATNYGLKLDADASEDKWLSLKFTRDI